MVIVDQPMVQTALPAEFSKVTKLRSYREKANGRGGVGKSIVAGGLVSRSPDMMATVVRTTAHLVPSVIMSFWGLIELHESRDSNFW